MAAQSTLSPVIQSRYDMIQKFEEGTNPLSFDVQKRQWVFTAEISAKIAKTASKKILENAGIMAAFKGISHGTISAAISLGRGLWNGILCGDLSVVKIIEVAGREFYDNAKTGAVYGALEGSLSGALSAYVEIRYSSDYVTITRNDRISQKATRILTQLFMQQGRGNSIICPTSGKIFHLPLRMDCPKTHPSDPHHICEAEIVMDLFQNSDVAACPFSGCGKRITKQGITLDMGRRLQISEIVKKSLRWAAEQVSEEKEVSEEEREALLMESSEDPFLLANEKEIIDRIQRKSLTGKDVKFLSYLVNKQVDMYNKSMLEVFQKLCGKLLSDMDKIGVQNYSRNQSELIKWMDCFNIDLSLPENV